MKYLENVSEQITPKLLNENYNQINQSMYKCMKTQLKTNQKPLDFPIMQEKCTPKKSQKP